MASHPVVFPPPVWTNQTLRVYHGTVDTHATPITAGPVICARGRTHTDFGPGFYTTTLLRQARTWAAELAATMPGTTPAVVELELDREDLARLDVLAFVRGDFDADDFWSLVHYCRAGATDHHRTAAGAPYYDAVYGPVAAFWNQRSTIAGADQLSFHTVAAEQILNRSRRTRII